jgi:hypothetical protein
MGMIAVHGKRSKYVIWVDDDTHLESPVRGVYHSEPVE